MVWEWSGSGLEVAGDWVGVWSGSGLGLVGDVAWLWARCGVAGGLDSVWASLGRVLDFAVDVYELCRNNSMCVEQQQMGH